MSFGITHSANLIAKCIYAIGWGINRKALAPAGAFCLSTGFKQLLKSQGNECVIIKGYEKENDFIRAR